MAAHGTLKQALAISTNDSHEILDAWKFGEATFYGYGCVWIYVKLIKNEAKLV